MIKSSKFIPETGILEPGSYEHKYANDLFEKKRQKNIDIQSLAMEALECYMF